ncbi:MAG: hypothetical protein ACHQM4_08740 [Thermoanaerobaculia bacterium]
MKGHSSLMLLRSRLTVLAAALTASLAGSGLAQTVAESITPQYPILASYLTVPAAASIHGLAGTFFHTDLWLINSRNNPSPGCTASYLCAVNCGGLPTGYPTATANIFLAPGEVKLVVDVVQSLFAAPETAGSIRLAFPNGNGLFAASRTYSATEGSTAAFGATTAALGDGSAHTSALFVGLASSGGDLRSGTRSNVGIVNAAVYSTVFAPPATVTITLFTPDGAQLGSQLTLYVPVAAQVTNIFSAVGADSTAIEDAYVVVTSDVAVFPWATVIDNQTGVSVPLPAY